MLARLVASITVGNHANAGARVRRLARLLIEPALPPQRLEDVLLVASELVGVFCGQGLGRETPRVLRVRLEADEGSVRVVVEDGPIDRAGMERSHPERARLVDALSARWGIDDEPVPAVWAQLVV